MPPWPSARLTTTPWPATNSARQQHQLLARRRHYPVSAAATNLHQHPVLDTFNVSIDARPISAFKTTCARAESRPLSATPRKCHQWDGPPRAFFNWTLLPPPDGCNWTLPTQAVPRRPALAPCPFTILPTSTNFTVAFDTVAFSTGAHGGWGGVKILDSTGTPQFVNSGNGFGIYWNNTGAGQVFTTALWPLAPFQVSPPLRTTHVSWQCKQRAILTGLPMEQPIGSSGSTACSTRHQPWPIATAATI